MNNEERKNYHQEILNTMHELYITKNTDYDSSVTDTYNKYGLTAFLVRIEDKLNRARNLYLKGEQKVNDEKLEDTILDLSNYATLALIELHNDKLKETKSILTTEENKLYTHSSLNGIVENQYFFITKESTKGYNTCDLKKGELSDLISESDIVIHVDSCCNVTVVKNRSKGIEKKGWI